MNIDVIIPAYNEQKTVGKVVKTVREVSEIREVYVVSDGSKDKTAEVAADAGANVIDLKKNTGKGGAVKEGVDRSDADIFLFLDADLLGLTRNHLYSLIIPVIEDEVDMAIGLFQSGRFWTDIAQELAPNLSGQRALKREVIDPIPSMDISRFGIEIALTCHAEEMGMRIKKVILPRLSHVMKEEKQGFLIGFTSRVKMYRDILQYRIQRQSRGESRS